MQKIEHKPQSGSILIAVLIGTILLSTSMLLLYRFYDAKISISKEVNSNISERNLSSLVFSYFSNEEVCSNYFVGRSLANNIDVKELFYTNGQGATTQITNQPFVEINSKASDFYLQQVPSSKASQSVMTKLNYIYKESQESLPRRSAIDIQVDLNSSLEITNCVARFFLKENKSDCNKQKNGTIRFNVTSKIPERCDGADWVPAVARAGVYGVFVDKNQQPGKCSNVNQFTGSCSCPQGFKSSLIYDFESRNCEWKYYWPDSRGCGYKVFECIKE